MALGATEVLVPNNPIDTHTVHCFKLKRKQHTKINIATQDPSLEAGIMSSNLISADRTRDTIDN